jgi:phosphoribosylaminoimidazolecarboxamide formyltransferase/IMP cyclohydrolase
MNTTKRPVSTNFSIFKEGLEPIVRKLHSQNVVFTGGTEEIYKKLRHSVTAVEDVTLIPPSWAEE